MKTDCTNEIAGFHIYSFTTIPDQVCSIYKNIHYFSSCYLGRFYLECRIQVVSFALCTFDIERGKQEKQNKTEQNKTKQNKTLSEKGCGEKTPLVLVSLLAWKLLTKMVWISAARPCRLKTLTQKAEKQDQKMLL